MDILCTPNRRWEVLLENTAHSLLRSQIFHWSSNVQKHTLFHFPRHVSSTWAFRGRQGMASLSDRGISDPDWCVLVQLIRKHAYVCQLSLPENLWSEFHDTFCEDLFVRIPNPTQECVHDYGLFLLDCILGESGYSLNHFPKMPHYQENWGQLNGNYLIIEQLMYNCDTELQSF